MGKIQKNNRRAWIKFRVTDEELKKIHDRMETVGAKNLSAYVRKLVLTGYVIEVDMSDLHEIRRLVNISSNNLNQYAKRANEMGGIYRSDMKELKEAFEQIQHLVGQMVGYFENVR